MEYRSSEYAVEEEFISSFCVNVRRCEDNQ